MAGKPNHETTDGSRKPRRTYERLGGTKRRTKPSSSAEGCPVPPEVSPGEHLADGLFVLDNQWRYTYVNRTGAASLPDHAGGVARQDDLGDAAARSQLAVPGGVYPCARAEDARGIRGVL